MLALSLLALVPALTSATFIGCFNDISGGAEFPVPDSNDCAHVCNVVGIVKSGTLYSATKRPDEFSPYICYCTGDFPGTDSLTDCSSDTWRTYESAAWFTWGCLNDNVYQANFTGSANDPDGCFSQCSSATTKWTVMQKQGDNYGCECVNNIGDGQQPRSCHEGSYYMYTNTD